MPDYACPRILQLLESGWILKIAGLTVSNSCPIYCGKARNSYPISVGHALCLLFWLSLPSCPALSMNPESCFCGYFFSTHRVLAGMLPCATLHPFFGSDSPPVNGSHVIGEGCVGFRKRMQIAVKVGVIIFFLSITEMVLWCWCCGAAC